MSTRLPLSVAKEIPITEFLSRMGINPAFVRGNNYWYHSPFRDDRTPSFKIDSNKNVWYDHGTGEGGTIIDLGMRLYHCSIPEFLERLNVENWSTGQSVVPKSEKIERKRNLRIVSVSRLDDAGLISYLERRGIPGKIACDHCRQVRFQVEAGAYDAIGFENRSGGFELRNHWFKGSSSPKDITVISAGMDKVSVFEGFVDFLSFLVLQRSLKWNAETQTDYVILNSLQLLNRSEAVLKSYEGLELYLDNDPAGREAKAKLVTWNVSVKDCSDSYNGYKDLNEFLVSRSRPSLPTFRKARGR